MVKKKTLDAISFLKFKYEWQKSIYFYHQMSLWMSLQKSKILFSFTFTFHFYASVNRQDYTTYLEGAACK